MKRERVFIRFLSAAVIAALLCQGSPAALAVEAENAAIELADPTETETAPESGDPAEAQDPVDPEEEAPAPEPVPWTSEVLFCPDPDSEIRIAMQWLEDAPWLFLPASAQLRRLTLQFNGGPMILSAGGEASLTVESGEEFDLTRLFPAAPEDGVYRVDLAQGEARTRLHIMCSAHIASLYLSSEDPARDRHWVEQRKGNKAAGSVLFLAEDGAVLYRGGLKQIKGRGNSTWNYPKKPYQIKLDQAADLMETGSKSEAAKTWVLLANYCDPSQLHNQLSYRLADAMELEYTPHCRPVDLYYDGEYRGCYLLCEKTEIGKGRIEIDDLEKAIEQANSAVTDMDALPVCAGLTPAGLPCQYVDGLLMPQEADGGYLLELDFIDRAKAEKSWFCSSLGKYVVCKSPEYLPKEGMDYISALWQEFEDAIVAGGVNPDTGRSYDEIMDLSSLAKCYLLEELSRDCDAFQSSAFFYKPAGEEKLYAGPVWDFDSAYDVQATGAEPVLTAGSTLLGKYLLAIPSFRAEVQRCYTMLLWSPVEQAIYGGLADLKNALLASREMDAVLWPKAYPVDAAQATQTFRDFLRQRQSWLYGEIMGWTENAVPHTGFWDVLPDDWYADAVDYVTAQGLFLGTSEISFGPKGSMTRAMIVTVLYRLAGFPQTQEEQCFVDVPPGRWYSEAVNWAAENGIALGERDGCFRPNRDITLQELLAFVRRYAALQAPMDPEPEEEPADETPEDVSANESPEEEIPEETPEENPEETPEETPEENPEETSEEKADAWAREDVAWAERMGIFSALQDAPSPRDTALRCHAAVIFQRLTAAISE